MWDNEPTMRLRSDSGTAPYKDISILKPSKGTNLLGADITIDDKEASAGTVNIEYAEDGIIRKRPGYETVGTGLVNKAKGIGVFMSENNRYPMTSDGGIVKRFTGGSWNQVAGSVTLDPLADVSFTALDGKTYVWDGVSGGVVWDNASLTRPGTMPRAKFSVVYKGYHVASGVDGQPFRVYFAPPKEPSRFTNNVAPTDPDDVAVNDVANVPGATVFTGNNSGQRAIDINRNDGEKVIGLGFFQDVLIVLKEQSIYQLYFNADNKFVVERISSSYGCVAHATVVSVENDMYFLSDNGVYVLGNEPNYYAAIRTNELSSRMKPLLQTMSAEHRARASATYFDDRYFLTIPSGGPELNTMIVYDRRFYAWTVWDNIYANDMLVFRDVNGNRSLYFTDDRLPRVRMFTWGVYNDDGQPIRAVFRTKAFDGRAIDIEKSWYVLRPVLRATQGSVDIGFITERGQEGRVTPISTSPIGGIGLDNLGASGFGWSMADTMTDGERGITGGGGTATAISTEASSSVFEVPVLLWARTCKIEFVNDKINESFYILGWKLYYQEKDFQRIDGDVVYR